MRVSRVILTAFCAALLAVLLAPAAMSQAGPVQAFVPTDYGDTTDIVARMEGQGWEVTAEQTLMTLADSSDESNPLSAYDVVWFVSAADNETLRYLLDGGPLATFLKNGGVVVVVDVNAENGAVDVAPGGVDIERLPDAGAGAVTIAAPSHAVITGAGIGGVALTDADLDPGATGGLGYLSSLPDEAIVIAQNASGPTVLEYAYGDGQVVVCSLLNPTGECTDNIVRYAESLVP